MAVEQPGPTTRWRCTLCGNLTRFDVARTSRTRQFVHVQLSGDPVVEESEVLADTVDHVTCRWCNAVDQVELVARPEAGAEGAEAPDSA